MKEIRNTYKTMAGKCRGRRPLAGPGMIILNWMLNKYGVKMWLVLYQIPEKNCAPWSCSISSQQFD
jgi:hypothetical protein